MARPIKETPVLKGKDARRFTEELKKSAGHKVSEAEYQRALKAFHAVKRAS